MDRKTIARDYLELTDIWNATDKDVVNNNLNLLFAGCKPSDRIQILSEISGVSKETVKAWGNAGRKSVKIPLMKLCKISEELGVDVIWFLEDNHRKEVSK